MAHHMERSFVHCFQIKLEFRSVGSNGGRKTGELRKKTVGTRREPITN